MDTPPRPDDLAQLRAQLAAQQARIAALEASRRRPARRLIPLALVTLLAALLPLAAFAANPFTDLDPAQATGHNPNIDAIYTAGITTGCNPPTNDNYCPKDAVTREQMASFLARLGGLGTNKPVANAARLALAGPTATGPTYAANDLLRVAKGVGGHTPAAPYTVTTVGPTNYQSPPVLTATITVPGPGFVLMHGALVVGTGPGASAMVRVRESTATTSSEPPLVVGGTGTHSNAVGNVWVFPVAAAGAYTYIVEANKAAPGDTVTVANEVLVALFLPFGDTGAPGP